MNEDRIIGCILGTAVGDAIGLPYEGLSRRRARRMLGAPDRHRFVFGRGMVSDDTEHMCLVAQSLVSARGDVGAFQQSLARGLRWWLLGLPAGIGLATLRSTIRLWLGVAPERSGVFSAGNGPAMRAAILGVSISDPDLLRRLVRASSRITHTDPKAEWGAYAVAVAARTAVEAESVSANDYLARISSLADEGATELVGLIADAVTSVNAGQTTISFADSIGLSRGVSGYINHTIPVAIHAWLSYPRDYRSAIIAIVECGGDTDSTAAIVGGIVGASVGRSGFPPEWLTGLMEWPRTVSWMERLGGQVALSSSSIASGGSIQWPIRLPGIPLVARNLIFVVIVLFHGFRRLLPPY
jgi:ADP-ribosyl-[dinitrogen reductase] hydrolase